MFQDLKIGILGGGQLGSMLIRTAIDFGLNISVMDKDPKAPCGKYTSSFYCADPMSYDDVMTFGKGLDIITIEKEAVNIKALSDLKKQGVRVYPSPEIVDIIQDKFIQKKFLQNSGIPVVPGIPIIDRNDLWNYAHKFPACLKKCRNGYDGRGVMILRDEKDIEGAFNETCVLEELVNIKQEISVIVSRNENGTIECYDPVTMVFNSERMVLDFQLCPANIDHDVAIKACNIAIKIAESLGLVGILAVEMFLTAEGVLLVNELAPRPHNSGHHTIEACATSQYEQQIRAMLGLPLGDTRLKSPSVMINILEPAAYKKNKMEEALKTLLCSNDVHLHWYGKEASREGRKVGHVTINEANIENAISKAAIIRHILKLENETNESRDNHGQ